MTQLSLIVDLDFIGLNIICWTSIAFPLIIATFWPWWESDWGRNLVSKVACLGLAVVGTVIKHDWGFPQRFFYEFAWLQALSLNLVAPILIWRIVLIWRKQRSAVEDEMLAEFKRKRSAAEKKNVTEADSQ